MLEELIIACVSIDESKRNDKKSEMREELWEINVLETEVAKNIKFKAQEKILEKLLNDYGDMIIECKET